MRFDFFSELEGIEGVAGLDSSHEMLVNDVALIELETCQVLLSHEDVILGPLELLQGLDDVGKHLYFLLLAELWVEIVGFEGLFEEWQHH